MTAETVRQLRRIYLDTSAYLCVVLNEKGAEAIIREISGAAMLSSVLLVLEARRNVIRLARDGVITPEECQLVFERIESDTDQFALRDLTLDLCRSLAIPVISTPRSLDLVHLRTALWFNNETKIDRFLTVDAAQAAAARELGLPTDPVGH